MEGLPDESVKPCATSDNSLLPAIVFDNIAKLWVKFKGSYSKWLMKIFAVKSKSDKASKAMKFWWQKIFIFILYIKAETVIIFI